ncbi:site-specific recombinase, phage integrase family [Klebsiella pneumoniae subsp. pneumoniae DSM 30104 = JCM 1662 = NBRC 14940]|nr:site-specific recombinase, phage integrase family [Klebsiella pneumoniae subsp. pneumoniae DSM 30104 = JCM 1662 = NBRC 14940]
MANEPHKTVNKKRVNQIIELAGERGMVSGTPMSTILHEKDTNSAWIET